MYVLFYCFNVFDVLSSNYFLDGDELGKLGFLLFVLIPHVSPNFLRFHLQLNPIDEERQVSDTLGNCGFLVLNEEYEVKFNV